MDILENKNLTTAPAPLESKFITLPDGVEVHYQESGSPQAPALLMAHGFIGSVRDWRFNLQPLAELAASQGTPRRLIAFDWVGFGRTSKPEVTYSLFYFSAFLKQFVDALHLSEFELMGHSMGGKHCLAFAILYPQYVKKLVLVDTDGFVKDPWWTNQTTKFWFKPLADLSTELLGKEQFLKAFAKRVFYNEAFYPTAQELKIAAKELQDPAYKKALRALNRDYPGLSLKLTGLRARLPEIKVPSLIYWGMQDKILPVDNALLAAAEIPNSELIIFDQCGHLPQVEKAAEFHLKTLDFLNR